jgi:hypothetical protein
LNKEKKTMTKRNSIGKVLSFPLLLALLVLVSMVWIQASVSPAVAQGPVQDLSEIGMRVEIIPENIHTLAIDTTPVFYVGDVFSVSIIAENVEEPGIFGSQFSIFFDTTKLQAVDDSLKSGEAMQPVVVAVREMDNEAGVIRWAASRQGDIENIPGDVVLATLSFEAVGATEPPEGNTTTIDLDSAKLGAKGGIPVQVEGLVDLEVIIREHGANGEGDMVGNVKVEGRADDNQAGHSVTGISDGGNEVGATTDTNGDFTISKALSGMYTLTANSAGFLAAVCEEVDHSYYALTQLEDARLLAGDIDDNRVIDIADAVAIGAVFENTGPGIIADLNADQVVDILDLILMSANYGQTSEGNPWVCQLGTEL